MAHQGLLEPEISISECFAFNMGNCEVGVIVCLVDFSLLDADSLYIFFSFQVLHTALVAGTKVSSMQF